MSLEVCLQSPPERIQVDNNYTRPGSGTINMAKSQISWQFTLPSLSSHLPWLHAKNFYSSSANYSAPLFNSQTLLTFSPYLQEKWQSIWIYLSGNFSKLLKIYMERSKSADAYSLPRGICIWPCCPHVNTGTSALWSEEPVIMYLRGVWVMHVLGTCFVSIGRPRTIHETLWAQTLWSSVYPVFLTSTQQHRDVGGSQASKGPQPSVWKGWALEGSNWCVTSLSSLIQPWPCTPVGEDFGVWLAAPPSALFCLPLILTLLTFFHIL